MNSKEKDAGPMKEWGTPRSNVSLFIPQEYCDSCYTELVADTSGTSRFWDWDDDGTCDFPDEYRYGQLASNENRGPLTVKVYALYQDGTVQITGDFSGATKSKVNGTSYSGTFSLTSGYGATKYSCKRQITYNDIKIINGLLYKSTNGS